jgi:hypothetical protein
MIRLVAALLVALAAVWAWRHGPPVLLPFEEGWDPDEAGA